MAPKKNRLTPRPVTLTQCMLHEESIRKMAEDALETHSLLQEIHSDMRWLKQEISVNGSSGLESILRDQYKRTEDHSLAIGELKGLTHDLKVNRQMRQAVDAWMAVHPMVARLIDSTGKKVGWMIGAAILTYLGIEGL